MMGNRKKLRGIMAVIHPEKQNAPNPEDPETSKPVSQLMLLLDEKSREADKLKKKLEEVELESKNLSRKADELAKNLEMEESFSGDTGLQIEALHVKGAEFDQKKNLLDAFYIYRRIIRIDPHDLPALYQIAALYYSAGLSKKASVVLRMILEIDPDQEKAARSLHELEKLK